MNRKKNIAKEDDTEVDESESNADPFYSEDEIESLLENDEISDGEEAFMMGYMEDDG